MRLEGFDEIEFWFDSPLLENGGRIIEQSVSLLFFQFGEMDFFDIRKS